MGKVLSPNVFQQSRVDNYVDSYDKIKAAIVKMGAIKKLDQPSVSQELVAMRIMSLIGVYAKHINLQRSRKKPLLESTINAINDLEAMIETLSDSIEKDSDTSELLELLDERIREHVEDDRFNVRPLSEHNRFD